MTTTGPIIAKPEYQVDMGEQTRELLYSWSLSTLEVLVPKKRGEGFLAQPLGHHFNKSLCLIETKLGCDICGLEGHLEIQCGMKVAVYDDKRTEFTGRAMALLSDHYGVPYREIPRGELYDILAAQRDKRLGINTEKREPK
jgi:hypothetical protein